MTTQAAAKSSVSRLLYQLTSALIPTRNLSHVAGVATATQTARTCQSIARPFTKTTRPLFPAHTPAASTEIHALSVSNAIAAIPATAWLYTATPTNGASTLEKSRFEAAQPVLLPAWLELKEGAKAFNELRSKKVSFRYSYCLL